MKPLHVFVALLCLALVGCESTPDSRIAANPSRFAQFAPEAQAKIKAGQIAVGFTEEEVLMARGQPDARSVTATATGTEEHWFYGDHRARIGFGLGFGSVGPSSAVGGSASVGGIPLGQSHVLSVTFVNGTVAAFESPVP